MKTFKLNRDSWHFRLANFVTNRVYSDTDICTYVRSVIQGALWLAFATAIVACVGGAAVFTVFNIFGFLFFGQEFHLVSVMVLTNVTILGLFIGIFIAKEKYEEKTRFDKPGFIRLAYRSWKDKFCAKVEFE